MSENNDIDVELLICDVMAIKSPQTVCKTLSPAERQRLDGITNAVQARLFLLGRYLLRQRLGRLLGQPPATLEIGLSDKGKPELAGGGWQFNLSHSGSLLALALSPHSAVGVDLERRQLEPARITRLARRYLAGAEQAWLTQSRQPAQDFQRLWTVKEAVLKAGGDGIANNLDRVEWRPGEPRAHFNERVYRLYQGRAADASLTLAVAGEPGRLRRLSLADCAPALEITGPQPNLAINP
ncbi:4'-phosphopantetheinyl transferase superfamily protein [Oceanimonas pelagia]|uniref:4'-phosphopantetheinyl transferase superfamily protein n=1 Tax=Oceanimonas pelagia TaxID=3028314 RepID=A0AA50QAY2_9GAMM|nr:4'-phosphopantetheinyl transferase superfamily protein [Oceanimonas pelagia]WMC09667.1 4'-phosphopantetheinyl transferase superfamily protein [Oceanimonas pelagia]